MTPFERPKCQAVPWRLAWLAITPFIAACSKEPASTSIPGFNDVSSASQAIQVAARAVVRVQTAGEYASGSFVSPTGLLLTNNHVLGVAICPIEGCSVEITLMHQHGVAPQPPTSMFAVPVAVDIGLDMALVQLYSSARDTGGGKLATPDFLTFDARDPASLVGTNVTIVGHPEGHLKKWTSGVVADSFGNWFQSTAYILPGDSGSPVLSDEGKLVGLIHRGPVGEDLFTSDGANVYSIGTASAPLVAAMSARLPSVMLSTAADAKTADDVVARNRVYLNAHASMVSLNGMQVSVLSLLGQACDAALARQDFQSPDDLTTAITPCYDAQSWIECRADAAPAAFGTVCPAADEGTAWAARFQALNARRRALNGELDLSPITFGIAALATSMSAGRTAGADSLQAALGEARPPVDFTVAYYLAVFGIEVSGPTNIRDFIRGYAKVPQYQLYASTIAAAATWLAAARIITGPETLAVLAALAGDRKVSVGAKLAIEDERYGAGALP